FYDVTARQACSLKPKYSIVGYNSTHNVECCTGTPVPKITQALPEVEVKNATIVQRLTKLVLYRGKPVQMIVLTFS
ncbi:hypothetical protein DRJ48_03085, partial [Candidatus Woesearchaeota archaeon]